MSYRDEDECESLLLKLMQLSRASANSGLISIRRSCFSSIFCFLAYMDPSMRVWTPGWSRV